MNNLESQSVVLACGHTATSPVQPIPYRNKKGAFCHACNAWVALTPTENLESDNAALIAATPPLKLPPPATLPRELYELLGLLKRFAAEERSESEVYAADAANSAGENNWANVAASNLRAARAWYRSEGFSIAAVELRDCLAKLAADAEREEA